MSSEFAVPRLRSRPGVTIVTRDAVVRAFLEWTREYEESPHKFLEETMRNQLTPEQVAEWHADTFLGHLKEEAL